MRIALISDIHGNLLALEAVLADIAAQGGVDAYWILGDFSSLGYDPVGVLERVTQLQNALFSRVKHPTVDFLTKMLRGELLPPWSSRR